MKLLKTNWLIKHSLTVFSCVLIIVLGITAITYATSIGEDISTNGFTATGLTVNGNAAMTGNLDVNGITTSSTILGGISTTQDLSLQTTSGVGETGADMHFMVGNNGGTEAMTILNNGNVGIGTDSPSVKFQISDSNETGNPRLRFYGIDSHGGDVVKYGDIYVSDYGNLRFAGTFDRFISTKNFMLSSSALEFGGAPSYMIRYSLGNTQFELESQDIDGIGTNGVVMQIEDGTDDVIFNGNIGIGTTDPSQELDIIGSLELEPTTSADTGVIYKGGDRFIHNYTPSGASGQNTFIGVNSGNFTMAISGESYHASYNMGFGYDTLKSITTGYSNIAIGRNTLESNTTGASNAAIGENTLACNQTGVSNVAIGRLAGYGDVTNHSFSHNTLIGYSAGRYLQTNANNNVLLGYQAGDSITTGTDNIIIGYDEDTPTVSTSNHLNIGGLIYGDLSGGNVGIGTDTPTEKFDINSDTIRLRAAKTPASATAVCDQGEIVWDANYIYICVATNSWKRSAIAAW